ncbi:MULTISPECIES: preprotein translocase subunit YajC [Halobacillus]|uniref:Preprotein translocase subunit YajC n=1 Tax=Halobacillus andaensis TaxID=1176239 RepID=A0A917AZ14_HALAA|nr:preprotein translocase subunit YajC [Halobacillus andaensis]MBP2002973.1 preprotein translocase subunit YajC [Halobacillus andaensis]GGF07066.1 preprotein translocase subunit YajC [Halobacillus andaensis]
MDTLLGLLPIILMFVIFYFLLIRPQQKKQKQVQNMQSELQKGDRVITIGGLHGTIHAIDEGTLIVSVQDGSQLKFDRSSVREKLNQD